MVFRERLARRVTTVPQVHQAHRALQEIKDCLVYKATQDQRE